jgi:multiple sugar transport system ATP-binding protein
MAHIRLEHLHKRFDDYVAVRDSSFTIEDGEFFVMLGPSGCGKTTTLRMIAGLELPTSGQILLDDVDVTCKRPAQRDIAFVFQMFALYDHMNVRRNLTFPLRVRGMPRGDIAARTAEVARLLRIEHLLGMRVGGLSSGDRQRVALGRAIVRRAKAFLMDEPLGALDAELREIMVEELRQLHERIGATTVYVTHDQIEAMAMADRICVMNHAEVLQIGTPTEVYDRPATQFVAGFVGHPPMNFLPAHGAGAGVTEVKVSGAWVPVPQQLEGTGLPDAVLGVRPEHVRLGQDGPLRGRVYAVEYTGPRQIVTVETDSGRLKAIVPNDLPVYGGELVGLQFATDRLVLFHPESGRAMRSAGLEVAHG